METLAFVADKIFTPWKGKIFPNCFRIQKPLIKRGGGVLEKTVILDMTKSLCTTMFPSYSWALLYFYKLLRKLVFES